MCVLWELNPQPFALLTQCSTTEPHRNTFWRKFVTRLFWGTIDFGAKKYYGSQWCPRTALFPTFFRISSFVFSRTKTFIQVWNYLRGGGGELWQNCHFWVNYPFKTLICCTLCAAELICMWKQSSSVSCCCINSCSIVCELWSNCLFAFSPELTCCSDSVPSTITSQAGNPSSNPSSLRLPLLIPSQVQSLAPILVDAERRTDIRIWGLFYWSFSSLKGS